MQQEASPVSSKRVAKGETAERVVFTFAVNGSKAHTENKAAFGWLIPVADVDAAGYLQLPCTCSFIGKNSSCLGR